MKRFIISIAFVFTLIRTYADEGMWLPLLLGQQVYSNMVKKGLKLTPDQLYNINKASLKDAVIIFSGFCTGEIVSNQGLIFTNHHCGFDAIASASTLDHNYLKDGFYAKDKGEEIPAAGMYADFLVRIDDVTKEVMDSLQGLSGSERARKQQYVINDINKRLSDGDKNIRARVSALFKGNQFLVFIYKRYSDIRLVGAPPESVGKFGGDTDNWEWPRHTGDFSIFRVYMNKDGEAANYDPSNIPFKPKYFLPVSIKGVKEGDYAMIWGYPGSTNRYETSYGVKLATEINNPTLVELRDVRLKAMFAEMQKDPAVNLQLVSDYSNIANYWKFYDGETKQLLKYDVYGQKKKMEANFMNWAKGKPEYENIFSDWAKAYDDWRPYAKHRVFINEGINGSPLLAFCGIMLKLESDMLNPSVRESAIKNELEELGNRRQEFLKSENKPSDLNIVASVLEMFYNEVDKDQHPIGFFESLKANFGDLKDKRTYKDYAASVFANTMIFNDEKWNEFKAHPEALTLQQDPAYATSSAFFRNYITKYMPFYQQFVTRNNELGRLYIKGIMEMDPAKAKKMYPDATFTMRVSYGSVKGYSPRDAVKYDYVTTMKGVLEKYKPGDYEFDLPDKLVELAKKKDFGQYIDKQHNDLVVCFITNNDITGGNSGSPVIDGMGNLIGLAFDGNYEAISHKISFDPVYNRTICVDIRYVLWCIDKLGGAENIIKELKIVK